MIRYTYFRFFFCKMKKGKTEKNVVLYISSFRFSFSESRIENRKRQISLHFPFS